MTTLKSIAAACLVIILALFAQPALAVAHKISFSDGAPELELGGSTTLTLTLDQPIICDPQVTCDVVVDFSGSLPQGLSISPSTVTWTASEWAQPRTITLNVDANADNLAGQTSAVGATVTSASTYYSGFAPSFELTVPSATLPPVEYDKRILANTGSNDLVIFALGLALIGAGTSAVRLSKKR
jgi:LPXTG-motif cell wall-anchored protein